MVSRAPVLLLIVVAATPAGAYEWKSHNSMAFNARHVLLEKVVIDEELKSFINDMEARGFGKDLDTRAGDEVENAFTDEDHNEGYLEPVMWCHYRERDCFNFDFTLRNALWVAPCTLDHFFPKLSLPVPNENATVHARRYFDMAVKLYKAAKCDRIGLSDNYRRGAARALGHAIHLAEDMGVPQHTRPENHAPIPVGLGPSFHEYWTLDVWSQQRQYDFPDGSGGAKVGDFQTAAAQASKPEPGDLESLMSDLAAKSRGLLAGSPYQPGTSLLLRDFLRIMAKSDPAISWVHVVGNRGQHIRWDVPHLSARQFPTYGRLLPHDELHVFSDLIPYGNPDYRQESAFTPPDGGQVQIDSLELAERLWAEPDVLHPKYPVELDKRIKAMLTHTTETAAGVILALWNEVDGYVCPCENFTPCEFQPDAKNPDCKRHRLGPMPPGGDFPDDTPGVVSTASSVTVPQVSDLSSADLSSHWPAIASIGVEKELPSLVDFGRTMYLMSLVQIVDLPQASQEQIALGIAELESKYSINRTRPEDDLPKAAYIGVLFNGFAGEAAAMLDALGWTHSRVPLIFDPFALAEDRRVLLVPSGGLYGTAGSLDLKQRLQAFVEAGGTLVVMGQMLGQDFTPVPTPPGETLKAYGWFEDQSCWSGNIEVAAAHPLTAPFTTTIVSVPVDGHIEQWPSAATVLLRKKAGGMPAMITYPLGAGRVVVTTAFEDWAGPNGRSTNQSQALLAGIVRWGISGKSDLPAYHWGSRGVVDLPVTLRNLTEADADTVVWGLRTSSLGYLSLRTEHQAVPAGASVPQHVRFTPEEVQWLGDQGPGIFTLTYSLQDSSHAVKGGLPWDPPRPWIVQPTGEAVSFLIEQWPDQVKSASEVRLGLAVESEFALSDSVIPVHVSVRNDGREAFSGVVTLSSAQVPSQTIAVAAGPSGLGAVDTVFGPLHLTTGHDGLSGGGSIVAELRAAAGGPVLVSAVKNILNNPTLLDLSFEAAEREAGVGDELHVLGRIANQSMGEVDLKYQIVFTNHYSPPAARCTQTTTGWRSLHLDHSETTTLTETYLMTAPCTGIIEAELLLCSPGDRCWTTGGGWTRRATAAVELPGTRVEVTPGEFDIVSGPSFRIPVRVRNVGKRPVIGGQVGLSYLWFSQQTPPEARSAPFDLPRDGETTIVLDLPLPPGGVWPKYSLATAYRDAYWPPNFGDAVVNWGHRTISDLLYGGEVGVVAGFVAPAGSTDISGTLEVRNRSSASRHFTLTADQDALGLHEQRDLDIGPLQSARTTLMVPVPAATPYGRWPMRVRMTDGSLINREFVLTLEHDPPSALIALTPDAASYQAGAPVSVRVDLIPGALAHPFPGTLEFECGPFGITETRTITLESRQRASQTFLFNVPADFEGGTVPFRTRWRWPDGAEEARDGSLFVPPPRFTVRPLQVEATAGGAVAYEIRNASGTPGTCELGWTLSEGAGWVAQSGTYVTLAPGATSRVTFPVPAGTKTGMYTAAITYRPQRQEASDRAHHYLTVTGAEASLAVGTGRPVYVQNEPIDGWAKTANHLEAFPNATLTLRVLAPEVCEHRVSPWGVFQGSAARDGVSPWHSQSTAYSQTSFCFWTSISLPAAAMPVAEAAGDLNEDGADDLLVLTPVPEGLALASHVGPDLARSAVVSLVGASSTAALAALDADGDGHLEVVEADITDGTALAVRCFTRLMTARWETRVPLSGDPGHPFPAGGPLAADLDGSGVPTVMVSTGRDVVALTLAGGVRWRMMEINPSLGGRNVTGVAAADCDGDGRSEVAVGLRSADGADGAVALLGGRGELRWLHATAKPVVANPAFAGERRQLLAFVQTPAASDASSTLTVLDSVTGAVATESTAPFRSAAGPAAGDLNGDGVSEFVVASDNAQCSACSRGIIAFSSQMAVLWSRALAGPPNGPPLLIDMDNNGTLDVIVDHVTSAQKDNIVCSRGNNGSSLSSGYAMGGPQAHVLPLLLLNPDGACRPAFVSGLSVVVSGPCQIPNVRALGLEGQPVGRLVWRWEGSASLAPSQIWDVAQTISLKYAAQGLHYLVGDLKNAAGQTVAHAEATFALVRSSYPSVTIDPLPQACRPDDEVRISGRISNSLKTQSDFVLAFLLDGQERARTTFTVAAEATAPFAQSFTAPAVGLHSLTLRTWPSSAPSMTASAEHRFQVVTPDLNIRVDAPTVADREPFTLLVRLANPTPLALALEVGVDVSGETADPRQRVNLPPGGEVNLPFQRQQSRPTTYLVRVTGDVSRETPIEVRYGVALEPGLAGSLRRRSGETVLSVELNNRGTLPWQGELAWAMTGATTADGHVPAAVAAGSVQRFDVPLTLLAGASTLRLAADEVVREFTLAAYPPTYGALTATIPEVGVEGDVAVLVRLENLLDTPGVFQAGFEVREEKTGAVVVSESRRWTTDGSAAITDTIPLDLAPGHYVLRAAVDDGPPVAPVAFRVVPRFAAELEVAVRPFDADGTVPLAITVRNTGGLQLAGHVFVEKPDSTIAVLAVAAAAGEVSTQVVNLDPDPLPAGDIPLEARLVTGDGQVLAQGRATVQVTSGELTISATPLPLVVNSGTTASPEFVVTNVGMQRTHYAVELSFNDGAIFSDRVEGDLRGGERQTVAFDLPLPADLPSCRLRGRYTLIAGGLGGEPGRTVASGALPIDVQGLVVTLDPTLDRDHVAAGEEVALSIEIAAPKLEGAVPLVAHVAYPPFAERREFELGPSGARLQFQVPIATPGGELGYGIEFPSGRALRLDARTIYPAGETVEIALDRDEYRPGETVTLAATLRQAGTLELVGFDRSVSLDGSGVIVFPIPPGLPFGRYPIAWTFYAGEPAPGVLNGDVFVKVRGPWVRIPQMRVTIDGTDALLRATIFSDTAISAIARAWVVGPTGEPGPTAEQSVAVEADGETTVELRLPFAPTEPGTHQLLLAIVSDDGRELVQGATTFDAGGGRILGVLTDRAAYDDPGDAVTALVTTQGNGPASLALRLDGAIVGTRSLALAGVERVAVPVPGASAGLHTLEAILAAAGGSSRASASFSVGRALPDLTVDLGGGSSEGGTVRLIGHVRNGGSREAAATSVSFWDGEAGAGALLQDVPIAALAPGATVYVPAEVALARGEHELSAWVNRSGTVAEFDAGNNVGRLHVSVGELVEPTPTPTVTATPTPIATATPTVQPTATPTRTVTPTGGATSVVPAARAYRIGEAVTVIGRAPDGSYCAAVVGNATWAIGAAAPAGALASADVISTGGVIPATVVWPAAAAGAYDVLLLAGSCGAAGATIAAAFDAGPAAGFDVGALSDPIPLLSHGAFAAFVALLALAGAWLLAGRRP